jgi:hypothetical protein
MSCAEYKVCNKRHSLHSLLRENTLISKETQTDRKRHLCFNIIGHGRRVQRDRKCRIADKGEKTLRLQTKPTHGKCPVLSKRLLSDCLQKLIITESSTSCLLRKHLTRLHASRLTREFH